MCPWWDRGWHDAPIHLACGDTPFMVLNFDHLPCKIGVFLAPHSAAVRSSPQYTWYCSVPTGLAKSSDLFFEGRLFWNIL